VIYSLNTKVDDHDDLVANLKSIHESENRQVVEEWTARVTSCEEAFLREKGNVLNQVEKVSKALEDTRQERDLLHQTQVQCTPQYILLNWFCTHFVCRSTCTVYI